MKPQNREWMLEDKKTPPQKQRRPSGHTVDNTEKAEKNQYDKNPKIRKEATVILQVNTGSKTTPQKRMKRDDIPEKTQH